MMMMMESEQDPFLTDCIEYAKQKGSLTRAMIQKKFKLGYMRAGRILEQMEHAGIQTDLKFEQLSAKQQFIRKWSSWWRLQKQHNELTDAFERELDELIKSGSI